MTLEIFKINNLKLVGVKIPLGDLPHLKAESADYYAMVAVKDFAYLPDSLVRYELTNKKMVKFIHRGPPQNLSVTTPKNQLRKVLN